MTANFYLKEREYGIADSVTISVMRQNKKGNSQIMNVIPIDKMPTADRKIIESAIALLEKYSQKEQGAIQIGYNL